MFESETLNKESETNFPFGRVAQKLDEFVFGEFVAGQYWINVHGMTVDKKSI